MTATFKTPAALDDSRLALDLITQNGRAISGHPAEMWVEMYFSASSGGIGIGAEFGAQDSAAVTWQPATWYSLKWVHAWDNQSRAKVWIAGAPEPGDWLVARTATLDLYKQPTNRGFTVSAMPPSGGFGSLQTFAVDDFVFSEAPVLPLMPVPPGTENNPPYLNQEAVDEPVSTFNGVLSDTHVDVAIPGRGPILQFSRSYNSNDTRVTGLGPGWTHSYNIRLVSPDVDTNDLVLIGPQGRSDRYAYSVTGFTPPTGVHRSLVQNADGTYTAADKSQTSWLFDPSGRLTQIRDRYGNASTLTYNANGQLATVSDPAGRGVLTLIYTNGRLTSVRDWAIPIRSVNYGYDGSGRLQSVTDREGKTTNYVYDGTSVRIVTIWDALGKVVVTNTYDAQSRVATQKDARGVVTGDVTTFDYVVNGDGTRVTTATAPTTSLEPSVHPTLQDTYSANGWLTQRVTVPASGASILQSFVYDTAGNLTSVTDPRGYSTDFCYDVDYAGISIPGGAGNLTRVIEPPPTSGANRPATLFRYDAKDNLTQTVAPKGVPSGATVTCSSNLAATTPAYAVDSTYDATAVALLSQTARFTDPDSGLKTAITKYEYGDAANPGRVTRVIPPRGNTGPTPDYTFATTFTYFTTGATAGLLKDGTDPLGNKTSYAYDTVGRLTASVDPLGNASGGVAADHMTQFSYDNEDRVRFRTAPAPSAGGTGLVSETRYDAVGNPLVRIDPNGQVSTFSYDDRGSLAQVNESAMVWTNPAAPPATIVTTEYQYDAGGQVTRTTRAKGDAQNERVVDYVSDGRGLLRRETQYPAWPSTSAPLVTSFTYDPAGNRLTIADPLGRTATSAYDPNSRLTAVDYSDPGTPDVAYVWDANGNRVSMTDGTGSTSYAHDEAGRLLSVASPGPKTVGYRYDLDGNRTKVIYPDATAVTYAFDKASRLASLADWASRSVSYTYAPDGRIKTATNPDTSVATYGYDNARRLVDIVDQRASTTIAHAGYRLDRAGNVTNATDLVAGLTQPPAWSTQTGINDLSTTDQIAPAVAIGPDGTVHAVWVDVVGTASRIFYSQRDPVSGTWGSREFVDVEGGTETQPAIAVDPAGYIYVAWTDRRNGATDDDIYFAKRPPGPSTIVDIFVPYGRINDDAAGKRQYDPSIAISPTGEAIAVWYDERGGGSKKYVYSARRLAGASTWSANIKVSSDSTAVKAEPEVAIGANGTAYTVWRDHRSGNGDIWFASLTLGASAWSTNTKINDDTGTTLQEAPDLGIDTAGNLIAVWNDARTTPTQIRARRRPAGTTIWSASVAIGGTSSKAPNISMRPDGRAYAAWSNGTLGTLTTVWGSEFDPATITWATAERLTDTAEEAASASVGFTPSELIVAYQRRLTGGNYDIYARRKSLAGDEYSYGYDRLYRLTSVAGPDGPRTYGYDPVGNRLSKVSGGTTAYAYDRADRITAAGSTSITVDANGNTIAKGADSFAFDQVNRLTSASVSGATETYAYDGDGTRFTRQVGAGPAMRYVSDVGVGLPTTIDDGTRKYVYGLGLEFAVSGSTIEVYHTDRLGSVRALTNASGTITAGYRADEWGLPTAASGTSTQPYRFTGEPRDATGLTYLRARYYDADLGRFTSRDTWPGSPSGSQNLNRYGYANGNPLANTDHSGHFVDVLVDIFFVIVDGLSLAFGPEKDRGMNTIALGADFGSIFVPFVTGAGLVTRIATRADGLVSKVFNVGKNINTETLEAARRELAGEIVKLKSTGVPYDHVQKVVDSQNGLMNVIGQVKGQLTRTDLGAAERQQLEYALSEASRLLDWTESYVPR